MFIKRYLYSKIKDLWIVNSSLSRHVTSDQIKFDKLFNYKVKNLSFRGICIMKIKGLESLMLRDKMSICEEYYVEGLMLNIIGVRKIFNN